MKPEHVQIGQRVLNRHRQGCDMPQAYRDANVGTVIGLHEGCNKLAVVQFDGSKFTSIMVPDDLALVEGWPK